MKRYIILCIAMMLVAAGAAFAQTRSENREDLRESAMDWFYGERPLPEGGLGNNPSIRELRSYYSVSGFHMESYDRFDPVWSGVFSAVVPGLGQIACGKPFRGILFFAGTAAPVVAAIMTYKPPYINAQGMTERDIAHTVALGGVAVAVWIWNVLDAAEVAILRDKYERDMFRGRDVHLSLNPTFDLVPSAAGKTAGVAGMSLTLNF